MCKNAKLWSTMAVSAVGVLGALLLSRNSASADQVPPGCAGNGSSGVIGIINGAVHHVGDAVDFTAGVGVPTGQCQASNVTARLTFPDGSHLDYATNLTLDPGTFVSCPNRMCASR